MEILDIEGLSTLVGFVWAIFLVFVYGKFIEFDIYWKRKPLKRMYVKEFKQLLLLKDSLEQLKEWRNKPFPPFYDCDSMYNYFNEIYNIHTTTNTLGIETKYCYEEKR